MTATSADEAAVVDALFDDRAVGPLAHGTDGWSVDVATGNSVEVVDTPSDTDRSVRITRASGSGSGGSALAREYSVPLTGTVTVQARVMRSDDAQRGFFGLPYVYNEQGLPAVSVAFARGEMTAYEGTTARVLGSYTSGQWYDLALTIDTEAQTYDLSIDGTAVLTDAALRRSLTGISRVSWYADGGERGAVHVDAVKITRDAEAQGTTYYVSADGDDTATGTSEQTPWRSLDKVNATTFKPGDVVAFRSGDQWTGQLWPKGSGSAGQPITIDAYGDGDKPRLVGGGQVAETVRLFNQEYWHVRNLDVSNEAPASATPGANLGDFRGIGIAGDNGTVLDHFVIDSVDVHDVTGEIAWIGGNPADDSPGVKWGTGWDRSKNTGGIVFLGTVADPAAPGRPTVLTDITVENSTVKNTSFAGITVKQYTGSNSGAVATGWGTRRTADDTRFVPHTDVTIRGNYFTQSNTDYGANAVYLTNVRDGLIEDNVIDRVGVSGIETYAADRTTVQFNEIYDTRHTMGSADANGFDPDIATTNQLFQYNYLHGNGDGILLCGCNGTYQFGSAVVRYNVVVDSTRWNLHMSQVAGTVAHVYNNTFHSTTAPNMVSGSVNGTVTLTNNIFSSTRSASIMQNSRVTYDNNGYSPQLTAPAGDTSAVVGAPWFADPDTREPGGDATTGPNLQAARAFALAAQSPFIDAGTEIADNGGADLLGTTVPTGRGTDLGALEYSTPAGATTEVVSGTVTNQYGQPVVGARVEIDTTNETLSEETGTDGRYTFDAVPFTQDAPIRVSAPDHATHTGAITVVTGSPTRYDVELTTEATEGTVLGRVLDESAAPISGAQVRLETDGGQTATATSAADGHFSFDGVAPDTAFRLVASLADHTGIARDGFTLTPTQRLDVGALYVQAHERQDVVTETFDDLPTGTLADGTNGWRVVSTGNAVDVVETPSATDKSARLTRTTGQGGSDGTNLARIFDTPLEGRVTIEADVMRDDSQAGWFGMPYVYNASGVQAISVAFARGSITAYEGGTSRTLGTYENGRWYHLTLTVDTVNQRYDLAIDGELKLSNAPFRTAMPGIAKVAWYANEAERGAVHVDDVRIGRGAEPTRQLDVAVEATPRCLAGKVYIAVRAVNGESVPIDVELTTPFGTKRFEDVAPGKNAYQSFATRAASIDAQVVTVDASATIDGSEVDLTQDVEVAPLSCG